MLFPEYDVNDSLFCQVNLTRMFMEDKIDQWPQETVSIFETIVKKQVFGNVSAILSLNKTNLLEEKIQMVSLKDYFL